MYRVVAARAVVLQNGALLCVRNKHHGKSRGDYWSLPGGNVEQGEPVIAALKRELLEEIGVNAEIGKLLYIHQFSNRDKDVLEFFFHVTNTAEFLSVDLSRTTHGLQEIAEIAFVDPAATYILPRFLSTEPLQESLVKDKCTKFFSYET